MESTISEKQVKELLKEVLIELMEENRDLFFEVMLEVLEGIGLENAIREGRQDEFVSEDQVLAILRGKREGLFRGKLCQRPERHQRQGLAQTG